MRAPRPALGMQDAIWQGRGPAPSCSGITSRKLDMSSDQETSSTPSDDNADPNDDGNLNDMLQELRILLQGVQVLTAFLIILPFNEGFARIDPFEKGIYVATFLCSISGLVIFSAPAAHHRLVRPLMDRAGFKQFATRMIIIGLIPTSIALVLATHLVISEVIGDVAALLVAGAVAVFVAVLWWVLPLAHKEKKQF